MLTFGALAAPRALAASSLRAFAAMDFEALRAGDAVRHELDKLMGSLEEETVGE